MYWLVGSLVFSSFSIILNSTNRTTQACWNSRHHMFYNGYEILPNTLHAPCPSTTFLSYHHGGLWQCNTHINLCWIIGKWEMLNNYRWCCGALNCLRILYYKISTFQEIMTCFFYTAFYFKSDVYHIFYFTSGVWHCFFYFK